MAKEEFFHGEKRCAMNLLCMIMHQVSKSYKNAICVDMDQEILRKEITTNMGVTEGTDREKSVKF